MQKVFAIVDAEGFGERVQCIVFERVDPRKMRRQHIDLRCLFDGLDQTEGFVEVFPDAVDAVHAPDDEAELLHLRGGRFTDLICAAEHPRQYADPVWEDDDTFGAHFPQRVGELLFIELMHVIHRQCVGRVAVHDDADLRIDGKPRHVAHQMRRQFARELAAVLIAPKQLRGRAVGGDADNAEVRFRVVLYVFEIFARTGDHEELADQGLRVKAGRDRADDVVQIEILPDLFFIEHDADIAAVALVPAEAVHILCRRAEFFQKRRVKNVFHTRFTNTFFS